MEDIINQLNESQAKKIFGNKSNALVYIEEINKKLKLDELNSIKKSTPTSNIWKLVVKNWNYDLSKPIIRNLFEQSIKYNRGKDSSNAIDELREEWRRLNLGKIEWPCS